MDNHNIKWMSLICPLYFLEQFKHKYREYVECKYILFALNSEIRPQTMISSYLKFWFCPKENDT